jgi:hypothetical protein
MKRVKKTLLMGLAAMVLLGQMPGAVAGQSGSLVNPMDGITQNEPEIIISEEVSFGEPIDSGKKPAKGKGIWITVGAVVIAGLVLGVAGGSGGDGGSSSGEPVNPASGTGDVSFGW